MSRIFARLLAVLLLLVHTAAQAQPLTVAAASDLQSVFPLVAERFERETTQPVRLTFGSSGNFFSQIQNGAPFDLFFSADIDYPERLVAAGLAVPGSLSRYASGRLVLLGRIDAQLDITRGLSVLVDPRIRRVAVANPQHAPYGRAAVAALRMAKLYDAVQPKLVFGENVSQAAQFVSSATADAALVALSVALAPAMRARSVYTELPAGAYPPIDQAAVVLTSSRHKTTASQFLAFVQRSDIAALLREHGFITRTAQPNGR